MKKQALAIAIASALVATPSFAAQDTSGMHYTSASEGFYASIRAQFETADQSRNASHVRDSSSRIGIQGTNDLGGGLEGFYRYELGVGVDNGSGVSTRMGHVGLRGAFGSFWVGSNWSADYNWTHGTTDVANNASGNFSYDQNGSSRGARESNAIEYTTPDLNGFQGAFRLNVKNSGAGPNTFSSDADAIGGSTTFAPTSTESTDNNDIDEWNLAANYAVQGFSVAGAYNVKPDGLKTGDAKDDANSWTFKLGYAQDNWYVNGWYGEDNTSDKPETTQEDATFFSIAGGVDVDKVNLYALYDQVETPGKMEDSFGTIGAQYNLGSNSRVWIEYVSRDQDTSPNADDNVNIGMRHDF